MKIRPEGRAGARPEGHQTCSLTVTAGALPRWSIQRIHLSTATVAQHGRVEGDNRMQPP